MIFNGIYFSDRILYPWLTIENVYPPETIGLVNNWYAGADGAARFISQKTQPYVRRVDVRIHAGSRGANLDKRRELIGKLVTDDLAKLQLEFEETHEMAKLNEVSGDNWVVDTLSLSLKFYCPYGCTFGETKTVSLGKDFDVRGTVDTPFTVTFAPGATSRTITHKIGGIVKNTLKLSGLTAAPSLTVDTDKQTVIQGTSTSRLAGVAIEDDFFSLKPGTNSITISGVSSGTITYTERWR